MKCVGREVEEESTLLMVIPDKRLIRLQFGRDVEED